MRESQRSGLFGRGNKMDKVKIDPISNDGLSIDSESISIFVIAIPLKYQGVNCWATRDLNL